MILRVNVPPMPQFSGQHKELCLTTMTWLGDQKMNSLSVVIDISQRKKRVPTIVIIEALKILTRYGQACLGLVYKQKRMLKEKIKFQRLLKREDESISSRKWHPSQLESTLILRKVHQNACFQQSSQLVASGFRITGMLQGSMSKSSNTSIPPPHTHTRATCMHSPTHMYVKILKAKLML